MKRFAKFCGLALVPAALGLALLLGQSASGQPLGRVVPIAADSQDRIDQLGRDVDRAEGLRAAKNLQYLYSQYAQYGLWDEMGALFTDDADLMSDGKVTAHGRDAITKSLKDTLGGGKEGLPLGALRADFVTQPVITMSYDGGTVTGRWYELGLNGQYKAGGGTANWLGAQQVNDYVLDKGVWKIAQVNFYSVFAGPYETGWLATRKSYPILPYHFSPGEAGRPVPDQPGGIDKSRHYTLDDIEHRVARMNDEDTIRNLQNKYGYYIDRKMWSDVTDLFPENGALEIAGQGIWIGPKSIRRELEKDGPEGLQRGQVNDHIQFPAIVTIDPNGIEARARGIEMGIITPKLGEAYWSISTFENRYVKLNGVWHISEMHLYPQMKADYYKGWGNDNIVDPRPGGKAAPDKSSPASDSPQISGAIPAFWSPNPVTGKPVVYPAGAKIVGDERLVPAPAASPAAPAPGATTLIRINEARRKLNVSKGYDATENLVNSFNNYLNDLKWDDMIALMSDHGTRPQGNGFYVGREHVYAAMTQTFSSGPPSRTMLRTSLPMRQRPQPVIDVASDGKSAKTRTRLLNYSASANPGTFASGMYGSDMSVVEDGVWKLSVGGEVEESYFASTSYKDGWAKPRPPSITPAAPRPAAPAAPRFGTILGVIDFPSDVPWALFQDFRLKDLQATNWPDIKPMWFAYRNPVSGRVPPNYCAVFLECFGYR